MKIKSTLLGAAFAGSLLVAGAAQASTNLIANGNFETGTLAGWTVSGTAFGANYFYPIPNGGNGPVSGLPTQANPGGGNYVAVSDQNGAGGAALIQSFTTPGGKLTLTFDWFNNTHYPQGGTAIDGSDSNQVGRVDILSSGASPFDVGSGVVQNLQLNAGTFTNFGTTIPWQSTTDVITGLAAGTYQLRFANGQCCFFQEFGVDNVSLTAVPEPSTWVLMLAGFAGLGYARYSRNNGKRARLAG